MYQWLWAGTQVMSPLAAHSRSVAWARTTLDTSWRLTTHHGTAQDYSDSYEHCILYTLPLL